MDPSKSRKERSWDHYAALDVSLKQTSVCIVDETGRIVREAKVASECGALIAFFRGLNLAVKRIGLEAGPWVVAQGWWELGKVA